MITTGLIGCGQKEVEPTVTVTAAVSLSDVIEEIVDTEKSRLESPVKVHTAGSQLIARQVAEGQPADIVFLANQRWMDYLEKHGTIRPETRVNLLSNRLVLIKKTETKQTIKEPEDLGTYRQKIALGNPGGVPGGIYAQRTLESMGIWRKIKNQVVSFPHVRATLSAVASGNIPLGIVYETDARLLEAVEIVTRLPNKHTPAIHYPIALVRDHSPEAEQWFEQLKDSQKLYEKYGFRYLLR